MKLGMWLSEGIIHIWEVKIEDCTYFTVTMQNIMPFILTALSVVNIKAIPKENLPLFGKMLSEQFFNSHCASLSVLMTGFHDYWRILGMTKASIDYVTQGGVIKPTPQSHPWLSKKINKLYEYMAKQHLSELQEELQNRTKANRQLQLQQEQNRQNQEQIQMINVQRNLSQNQGNLIQQRQLNANLQGNLFLQGTSLVDGQRNLINIQRNLTPQPNLSDFQQNFIDEQGNLIEIESQTNYWEGMNIVKKSNSTNSQENIIGKQVTSVQESFAQENLKNVQRNLVEKQSNFIPRERSFVQRKIDQTKQIITEGVSKTKLIAPLSKNEELRMNIKIRKLTEHDIRTERFTIPLTPEKQNHRWLILDIVSDFTHMLFVNQVEWFTLNKIKIAFKRSQEEQKMVRLAKVDGSGVDCYIMKNDKDRIYLGPFPLDVDPVIVLYQCVKGQMLKREDFERIYNVKRDKATSGFWLCRKNGKIMFDLHTIPVISPPVLLPPQPVTFFTPNYNCHMAKVNEEVLSLVRPKVFIELNPTELNQLQSNQIQLNQSMLNQAQLNEAQLNQTHLSHTQSNQTQLHYNNLNPTQSNQLQLNNTQSNPNQLDLTQLYPAQLNQPQFRLIDIPNYTKAVKTDLTNQNSSSPNSKQLNFLNKTVSNLSKTDTLNRNNILPVAIKKTSSTVLNKNSHLPVVTPKILNVFGNEAKGLMQIQPGNYEISSDKFSNAQNSNTVFPTNLVRSVQLDPNSQERTTATINSQISVAFHKSQMDNIETSIGKLPSKTKVSVHPSQQLNLNLNDDFPVTQIKAVLNNSNQSVAYRNTIISQTNSAVKNSTTNSTNSSLDKIMIKSVASLASEKSDSIISSIITKPVTSILPTEEEFSDIDLPATIIPKQINLEANNVLVESPTDVITNKLIAAKPVTNFGISYPDDFANESTEEIKSPVATNRVNDQKVFKWNKLISTINEPNKIIKSSVPKRSEELNKTPVAINKSQVHTKNEPSKIIKKTISKRPEESNKKAIAINKLPVLKRGRTIPGFYSSNIAGYPRFGGLKKDNSYLIKTNSNSALQLNDLNEVSEHLNKHIRKHNINYPTDHDDVKWNFTAFAKPNNKNVLEPHIIVKKKVNTNKSNDNKESSNSSLTKFVNSSVNITNASSVSSGNVIVIDD